MLALFAEWVLVNQKGDNLLDRTTNSGSRFKLYINDDLRPERLYLGNILDFYIIHVVWGFKEIKCRQLLYPSKFSASAHVYVGMSLIMFQFLNEY